MLRRLKGLINISDAQYSKYTFGTLWMLLEKFIRLGVNMIVGIWLARYLGPQDFGLLSFGTSIAAIVLPIVNFGLQGILVKELFEHPERKETILGSTFIIKTIASIVVLAGIVLFFRIEDSISDRTSLVIFLACISILFQGFLVLDSWYESQVRPKWAVVFKSIFFIVASMLKVWFILDKASVTTFALLYSVEIFFIAVGLLLAYQRDGESILRWKFKWDTLKHLISKSWLLILSSVSAVIYLKIDQIMIGSLVSDTELGYYSAAVKLSEAWYFIPLIISNALFPAILSAKTISHEMYINRLQRLSNFYYISSVGLALFITFMAHNIIYWLYGPVYDSSITILQIHIWAGVFIFLRSILSKWLIAEELFKYSLISQVSGAIVNVGLNFLLIPIWGGMGAAISTLFSYMVSAILILGFFKETREIFWIFIRSIGLPLKILRS